MPAPLYHRKLSALMVPSSLVVVNCTNPRSTLSRRQNCCRGRTVVLKMPSAPSRRSCWSMSRSGRFRQARWARPTLRWPIWSGRSCLSEGKGFQRDQENTIPCPGVDNSCSAHRCRYRRRGFAEAAIVQIALHRQRIGGFPGAASGEKSQLVMGSSAGLYRYSTSPG